MINKSVVQLSNRLYKFRKKTSPNKKSKNVQNSRKCDRTHITPVIPSTVLYHSSLRSLPIIFIRVAGRLDPIPAAIG